MQTVGHINIEIYRCISSQIITDEVILTDERARHIQGRRENGFLTKYERYFAQVLADPDYIFLDDRPNTALVCKTIEAEGASINLVLRLAVEGDDPSYKNSILTAVRESKKRFEQRLRNHTPIFKKI